MADNVEIIQIASSEAIYQQDKALVDTQVATANAYPRNVTSAINDAIAIVQLDEQTAQSCTYSVPRAGGQVSGPSIHLAKIIAQNWGNLRIDAKVVSIEERTITSQATCFDLQKNIAVRVEVKRSIWGKAGRFKEDMVVVTGNAANAIAMRNAIFAVIPEAVTKRIYDAAQRKIIGDVSSEEKLIAARKRAISLFVDNYRLTEAEILKAIGKQSISHIGKDELVTLAGIDTAIKEGDTTVGQAFKGERVVETEEKKDPKSERIMKLIENSKTVEDLDKHKQHCKTPELSMAWDEKFKSLKK